MKGWVFQLALLVAALPAGSRSQPQTPTTGQEGFEQARFGWVRVLRPVGTPVAVTLFLSGDGGWEKIVADMSRALCNEGALVIGVDLPDYVKRSAGPQQRCFYPAGHLEELAKAAEQYAGLPDYQVPLVVGYSSGATLAYVAAAQAPAGTFSGVLSLGFCPDLEVTPEPCQQNGLHCRRVSKPVPAWLLAPEPTLTTAWRVLQGANDQCCPLANAEKFVRQIPAARLVALLKVGHGYKVEKNWLPQFRQAFAELLAAPAALAPPAQAAKPSHSSGGRQAVRLLSAAPGSTAGDDSWWAWLEQWLPAGWGGGAPASPLPSPAATDPDPLPDLPLQVTPATSAAASDCLAVFISGDGGWKDFDQHICDGLAAAGIPVVGLNALKYFWTARTPESAAWDLTRILQAYQKQWGKKQVVLIGYSFGADVLPFLFNRLNDAEKNQVITLNLISPDESADFEFHLGSWANHSSNLARPVKPELEKMTSRRVLFLCSTEDEVGWLKPLAQGSFHLKTLPGGHHFAGDTKALSDALLAFLK